MGCFVVLLGMVVMVFAGIGKIHPLGEPYSQASWRDAGVRGGSDCFRIASVFAGGFLTLAVALLCMKSCQLCVWNRQITQSGGLTEWLTIFMMLFLSCAIGPVFFWYNVAPDDGLAHPHVWSLFVACMFSFSGLCVGSCIAKNFQVTYCVFFTLNF